MSTIINAGRIAPIPKGDYNAATAYEHLDIVSYEGSSYICKQDTTAGILPTNTEYWQLMSGQATPIDLSEYAKLASPAFTGTPTAPTATSGTNTTQLATTAFVQTAISGKQDTLTFDNVPTDHSTNPVISGGVYSAINDVTKLTITVTYDDGDNIVADKTYTQILAAYNRGREIVLLDHGAIAPLIAYEEGTNTFTFDQESSSNPTFHIIYTVKRENNADVWTWRGYGVQSALVSGLNIKTVNNTSLLGSGDIDADDVIMGKIDGTSFYKVTGYSALNATPTFSDTAETGNENKIYVDILTNRAYRWDNGVVLFGENHYKLLSEELSVLTDSEINSMLPPSTKKAVSAKVLRDNFYTETEVNAAFANYCPIIEDTRSSAVAAITGVAPFDTLVDGQRIVVKLKYTTSANATLTLTGLTNALPIYARCNTNNNSDITPIYVNGFVASSYMELIYDATNSRWICTNYDRVVTYEALTQSRIDSSSTAQCVITGELLRDNFYLKSEINTMIGDIETLLASI